MTRKDFQLIAQAVAECEQIIEFAEGDTDGIYALKLFVAQISPMLQATNSRFNPSLFKMACFPREHERQKQAILTKLGMEAW